MYSSSDFIKSTAERDLIPIVLYTVLTDRFYFQSDAYETLWDDSLCVGNYISSLYYQRSLTTKSAAVLTKFRVRFSGHIKKNNQNTYYTIYKLPIGRFFVVFFYIFLNFHYYIIFRLFFFCEACVVRGLVLLFSFRFIFVLYCIFLFPDRPFRTTLLEDQPVERV